MSSRLFFARRIPQALQPRSFLPPSRTPRLQSQIRAMASSPNKFEYLVVIPDRPNSNGLRLEVRDAHLANMKVKVATGDFKEGGALLNTVPESMDSATWDFHGSAFVVAAHSKDEVVAHIKDDIYYQAGVWDLENAQIVPFFAAFRFP